MRTVTVYECGICRSRHDKAADAARCEATGEALTVPDGTIFQLQVAEGDLAIVLNNTVFAVVASRITGHANVPEVFVTRDDGGQDTTGDWVAALPCAFTVANIRPPNQQLQAFQRMVYALRRHSLRPRVWDGRKAALLVVSE